MIWTRFQSSIRYTVYGTIRRYSTSSTNNNKKSTEKRTTNKKTKLKLKSNGGLSFVQQRLCPHCYTRYFCFFFIFEAWMVLFMDVTILSNSFSLSFYVVPRTTCYWSMHVSFVFLAINTLRFANGFDGTQLKFCWTKICDLLAVVSWFNKLPSSPTQHLASNDIDA